MKLQRIKALAATVVITAVLGTTTLIAVPQAYADDHARCQHEIEKREAKLDQAIRRHGEHSHQAEDRRRDLNAERERCWNQYHGWWNGHDHQWHSDRDWDNDHR